MFDNRNNYFIYILKLTMLKLSNIVNIDNWPLNNIGYANMH